MPTAGVKGVCPLSPFFKAKAKLKYIDLTLVLSTRFNPLGDSAIIEIPGGHANTFENL